MGYHWIGEDMHKHDIIVIGASSGGVEALIKLVQQLPRDFPAAIFIVMHVSSEGSMLPQILGHSTSLPVAHVKDKEIIKFGKIYIAPPDNHLLIRKNHVRLTQGSSENGFRPAVDPLFRSAARFYRERVIGIILSGSLDDGTQGLMAVKSCGGITIVEDPKEAIFPQMPESALRYVEVDYCLPLLKIGPLLVELSQKKAEEKMSKKQLPQIMEPLNVKDKSPTAFTCPDCGGSLWQLEEGKLIRFKCRVGHAYSVKSVVQKHSDTLDHALWVAFRTLQEHAHLLSRIAKNNRNRNEKELAQNFEKRAQEKQKYADIIRKFLTKPKTPPAA